MGNARYCDARHGQGWVARCVGIGEAWSRGITYRYCDVRCVSASAEYGAVACGGGIVKSCQVKALYGVVKHGRSKVKLSGGMAPQSLVWVNCR